MSPGKEDQRIIVVATYNLTNIRKTLAKFIEIKTQTVLGPSTRARHLHQIEALAPGFSVVHIFFMNLVFPFITAGLFTNVNCISLRQNEKRGNYL